MPTWTAAQIDEARRLFETTTLSVARIAGQTGIPTGTLWYRIRKEGWSRGPGLDPALHRPASPRSRILRRVRAADRQVVNDRIFAALVRLLEQTETRIAKPEGDAAAEERSIRALTGLQKAMREVVESELRSAVAAAAMTKLHDTVEKGDSHGAHADGPPAPGARPGRLDDLHHALARAMAGVFSDPAPAGGGPPPSSGDGPDPAG